MGHHYRVSVRGTILKETTCGEFRVLRDVESRVISTLVEALRSYGCRYLIGNPIYQVP